MFKYVMIVLLGLALHSCFVTADVGFNITDSERLELLQQKKQIFSSGKVEGDMVIEPGFRNGVIDERLRWPNRVVPYELDPSFDFNEASLIHQAVKEFAAKTCVTVRPRTAWDVDYVYVTAENTGCWSKVGRIGGPQQLNLQRNWCVWYHTIVHEFMHAVGFYHMQSNTNRDYFVDILWPNIQSHQRHNFEVYGPDMITDYGQQYDYGSIMHYDEYAFSANGQPTLRPKDPSWIGWVGVAKEMSQIDAVKVNAMYRCY